MKVRDDFPMLRKKIIYFDNGATTFKPHIVIDSVVDYYSNYSANAHRGDYDISLQVDDAFEAAREKVKKFINAKTTEEIIFTSGTTDSLNMIIKGYFKNHLNSGDEILITKSEHASLVLPWFLLGNQIGCVVKYIDLDQDLKVTIENVTKAITNKTKVIALSHITNVIGDIRPIKEISKLAHQRGILVMVDGAQSVPHIKVDVEDLGIDFLGFSGHKMLGPTGIGVLYGKLELLEKMKPQNVGGGMNDIFTSLKQIDYKPLPHRLEAGTPNIAGAIGLGAAIDYLEMVGMDNISKHDQELKRYAVTKLSKLDNIEIYNANTGGSIIAFNVKGVFSQDTAIYLNKHNICVRAGSHCAKMLSDNINVNSTCRLSFYLYNTKEEIDRLVELLKNKDILKESL